MLKAGDDVGHSGDEKKNKNAGVGKFSEAEFIYAGVLQAAVCDLSCTWCVFLTEDEETRKKKTVAHQLNIDALATI